MKAIISDIHGNLPAVEAVLEDIENKGITEIVCLGDVIGYGPFPNECLEVVRPCDTVILGNHEEAVLNQDAAATFNSRARRAVTWTRKQVLEPNNGEAPEAVESRRQFMESFLMGTNVEGIQYVHASPRSPTREYITPKDARNKRKMGEIFAALEWVCFVGHTHVPGVFTEEYPLVEDQGRESLNFQISTTIYLLVSLLLVFVLVGIVLLPVVAIWALVMTIIGAVKANDGQRYRYPMTIRFISPPSYELDEE